MFVSIEDIENWDCYKENLHQKKKRKENKRTKAITRKVKEQER